MNVEIDGPLLRTLLHRLEDEVLFISVAAAEAMTYKARRGQIPSSRTDQEVIDHYDEVTFSVMQPSMDIILKIACIIFHDEHQSPTDDGTPSNGLPPNPKILSHERRSKQTS